MTTFTNSTSPVPSFDTLLAKMEPHFRYYAKRFIRRKGSRRFDFDDVMQDLIGIALKMYRSLIRRGRGKEAYFTPIMQYTIKRHRAGRRLVGSNTTDLLAEQTQVLGRCDACQLSQFDVGQDTWDFMQDRHVSVVDSVQMSMDYETWLQRQTPRDQKIITDLSHGFGTCEVAKKYGVSAALISQYRNRYAKSWKDFIADTNEPA